MSGTYHHEQSGPDQIHVPYAWTFANQAARETGVGIDASGIGKLARQLSPESLWMLTGTDPVTWQKIGSDEASVFPAPGAIPRAGEDGKLDAGWIAEAAPSSGYAQYLTPGTFTFVVPENVTAVFVELHGGGAGGGGNSVSGGTGGTSSFGPHASATGGQSGNGSSQVGPNGSTVNCNMITLPNLAGYNGAPNPTTGRAGGAGSLYGYGGGRAQDSGSSSGTGSAGGRGAGGGASVSGTSGGAGGHGMAFVSGLVPGASITVVVGSGGNGGVLGNYRGGPGGPGFVRIWW